MKILILIPTKDTVDPKVLDAIHSQDYSDYSVLINKIVPEAGVTKLQAIADNHRAMREKALASDADYFLMLDNDIVLPKNALSTFVRCAKPIMGGSYPIDKAKSSTGSFEGKNFVHFTAGVTKEQEVGHLAWGCMMVSREAMEKVPILDCAGEICPFAGNPNAPKCNCMKYCEEAKKLGYALTALPINCQHILDPQFVKMPLDIFQQIVAILNSPEPLSREVNKVKAEMAKLSFIE